MYFTTLTEMQSFIENEHFDTESTLMLMVADQNADDISAVTSYLNQKGLTFFGGIYSGLLVGNKNLRTGFIMEMVKPAFCSMALPFIMPMKTEQKSLAGKTAIVLVDGLSSKMKDLINTIHRKVGSEVNYIGGGAGFYSIAQHCIKSIEGEYKPLLFNCISRAMFMEDIFEQELSNIQNQLCCTVEGALSIGELASSSDGEIIIHNKSTVLALLQE